MITNTSSGTNLHEIAPGIYRINTPVEIPGGIGFNFNQYLIADDEPLLFHTGPRRMFPLVAEAIGKVLPLERLRYVAFSHFEADECGVAQRLPRRRARRRSRLQPGRRDGVGQRRCRPPGRAPSPTARCSRTGRTRLQAGSTRRTCRTAGNAAS